MKLFISALAALIVSVPAFAGNSQTKLDNTSWEQIESQRAKYFVDAQSVKFSGSNGGTFYKRLLNVDGKITTCVYGDYIYGGVGKVCKKWVNNGDGGRKCAKYAPTELWAKTSGTQNVCVRRDGGSDENGACTKWIEIDYTIDTNTKAAVFNQGQMDKDRHGPVQGQDGFLGFKRRQLPNCSM